MDSASGRARGRPRDEQLPERRREEILAVASGVFARDGFAGADVQEIADTIGVGKGTIYRYFASKRELFLAAADREMRALTAHIDRRSARVADPLDKVTSALKAYLEFFDERSEAVELIIQERAAFRDRERPTYFEHRDANIGRWRGLLGELMRAGRVRRMPVQRILDVVSDLLYGTIFTNHFAGRRKSLAAQSRDILDIVMRGILSGGGAS